MPVLRSAFRVTLDGSVSVTIPATSANGSTANGDTAPIFSLLAIRDNIAPPTINLDNPERETAIDLVPNKPRARQIDVALSNSFGFGGTNASLVFQRYNG